MNHVILRNGALLFELDGVVRRFTREAAMRYIDQYHELPPAPLKTGEQTLVEPVVSWLVDYCQRERVVPVGVDMAPYLSQGFDEDVYADILKELTTMLREAGLPVVNIYTCPHAAEEASDWTPDGREIKKLIPVCNCKFPNPGLLYKIAERHGITLVKDFGAKRFVKPSLLVHVTKEGRDAAIDGCGLNTQHVNGILSGSCKVPALIENVHLSAAALIKDHQRRVGLGRPGSGAEIDLDVRDLPDLPPLPPQFDRPAEELRP